MWAITPVLIQGNNNRQDYDDDKQCINALPRKWRHRFAGDEQYDTSQGNDFGRLPAAM
jgi:hypothetical protein